VPNTVFLPDYFCIYRCFSIVDNSVDNLWITFSAIVIHKVIDLSTSYPQFACEGYPQSFCEGLRGVIHISTMATTTTVLKSLKAFIVVSLEIVDNFKKGLFFAVFGGAGLVLCQAQAEPHRCRKCYYLYLYIVSRELSHIFSYIVFKSLQYSVSMI